jgi:hypothetical protein
LLRDIRLHLQLGRTGVAVVRASAQAAERQYKGILPAPVEGPDIGLAAVFR